ncbi:uncharacterized protein BO87DRAFT_180648 [Aspergillus neoniger CBS 115656]|uniref:Uncharacterized protein n=1 Tax=Aspergillus neoniger (strain CBS 115656) TaxID=1448310 RepID=A0A318Y6J9_ASPNB|nr:hypothetical protein BO87DRAFT_180648 [Aspergillus neoniger CBS 115656]PYH29514.1 hypothetical protein BO87DRAFT_180648 [Aspergillus neoniger CBS 115656]
MSSGPIGAIRSCGDSDTIIGCHSFFFPGHHGSFFRLRMWELGTSRLSVGGTRFALFVQPASLSHRKQICQHCLFLSSFCYFFGPGPSLSHTETKRVLPNRASPLSLNQFSILSRSRLVRPGSSSPSPAASSSTRLLVLCFATKTSSDLKQKKGAPKHTTVLNPGWILPRQ